MTDTDLIPGLPYDVALECLTRLHYTTHRVASRVNKTWNNLIKSKHFYILRKRNGLTRKLACLIQSLPSEPGLKPISPVRFGLTTFDFTTHSFDKIDPVPEYLYGLPLFCQVIGSEGRVIVMGGWDPVSYEPVQSVFVYEFVTRSWKRGKNMPDSRSFFAAGEVEGKVYIAGGHDESKNALSSAWVYDLDSDKWTELTQMSQERDECEGVVVMVNNAFEFCVVSGYRTESQGLFEESIEKFDVGEGTWRRVEGAWRGGVCPRGRVGVKGDGELFDWGERVGGACAVGSGDVSFVCRSEYEGGGVDGFWVVDGAATKVVEVKQVDGFSGFVQSGCLCEI